MGEVILLVTVATRTEDRQPPRALTTTVFSLISGGWKACGPLKAPGPSLPLLLLEAPEFLGLWHHHSSLCSHLHIGFPTETPSAQLVRTYVTGDVQKSRMTSL